MPNRKVLKSELGVQLIEVSIQTSISNTFNQYLVQSPLTPEVTQDNWLNIAERRFQEAVEKVRVKNTLNGGPDRPQEAPDL